MTYSGEFLSLCSSMMLQATKNWTEHDELQSKPTIRGRYFMVIMNSGNAVYIKPFSLLLNVNLGIYCTGCIRNRWMNVEP